MNDDTLADYRRFISAVDDRMAYLHRRHGARLTCHRGCDDCCRVDRSALPIEAASLRVALGGLPATTLDRLRASMTPGLCPLLVDGLCVVYEARPLICRTHGAPLLIDTGDAIGISICELNMAGFSDRDDFSDDDLFDTIDANSTLALLNDRFIAKTATPPDRVPFASLLLS